MTCSNIPAEIHAMLDSFKLMLAVHDKYFDYSDDHAVYSKGLKEWNAIQAARTELVAKGYKELADLYFKEWY
jgi:hypothetical protein